MAAPSLTEIAYHTLQQGKTLAGIAHKELSSKLMGVFSPDSEPIDFVIDKQLLIQVQKSISELAKLDWDEAEKGIYPKSQLFEAPWIEWAKNYPLLWLDMPNTWVRRKKNKTKDMPKNIIQSEYPDYYLQNFHHQTDGYLSEHSAEIYDLQVEMLFYGTADSMRRRVLSPLNKGIEQFKNNGSNRIQVLDIATGTGRTLQQIKSSLPDVELYGLDLSGHYLKQASKYLSARKGEIVQLIKANAEQMPFPENNFEAITCVFLLHELPRAARQNVINECFRCLKPGGTLVLADSIQIEDSPNFSSIMENFHKVFHEPYYRDYINDNIEARFAQSGFKSIQADSHFMTRVWSATKPE